MDKAGRVYRLEHIGRRFRWVDATTFPNEGEADREFTTLSEARRWAVATGWFVMN
jgi:hypothetical protein